MERAAVAPDSEEYLNSEKYQVRHWDLERAGSLAPFIGHLNRQRRAHPALQRNDTLRFHDIDNDQIVCWSKHCGSDRIVGFVSLDGWHVQEGWSRLDLAAMGMDYDETFVMHDLLTDARYPWRGGHGFVRLDPATAPGHLFEIVRDPEAN